MVRYEFRHFAFIGVESTRAAKATECANEQEMFWPYHDVVFLNQSGENQGAFSALALRNFAEAVNLDLDAYDACVAENGFQTALDGDMRLGQDQGVKSTPTLVINGEVFEGALPYAQIQSIIQAELAGGSG